MLPLLRVISLLVDTAVVAAAAGLGFVGVLLSGETGWGALGLAIIAVPSAPVHDGRARARSAHADAHRACGSVS
jgi:hypothetical protein